MLVAHGQVIYENSRYGNRYLVDRAEIERLRLAGHFPVVHMGQIAGARSLMASGGWLVVRLSCDRAATLTRSQGRGDLDVDERLAVWDETEEDLAQNEGFKFALTIDTVRTSPNVAAERIAHNFLERIST